jgi:hypothetical protein
MRTVISASRRTDLVAFFPEWLAGVFRAESAAMVGPRGRARPVDLRPAAVHSIVLWSKDFSPLIRNAHGLRDILGKYDQLYLLFTVTGLGGTAVEEGVPAPAAALAQLPALVALAGHPRRVSLRFDPVVHWMDGGEIRTNLPFFEIAAEAAAQAGIEDVRHSFTQWYGRALRRAKKSGFAPVDPTEEEKLEAAGRLAETASRWNLRLHACSQNFLARAPGIRASSCIDGHLLQELHPRREEASMAKDKSQRDECGCTASLDIGSYTQPCSHACLYCYANPKIS